MKLHRYIGNRPASARRDAKYSVVNDRESPIDFAVRLQYWADNQDFYLLTTQKAEELVEMVNAVKGAVQGAQGGAFYVNEHRQVIVPAGGDYFLAGDYPERELLSFDFKGGSLSAYAPPDLEPGAPWKGPRPGIPYVLAAGGEDFYYDMQLSRDHFRRTRLSNECDPDKASDLARRLAQFVGRSGGRVYINEAQEFFGLRTATDMAVPCT